MAGDGDETSRRIEVKDRPRGQRRARAEDSVAAEQISCSGGRETSPRRDRSGNAGCRRLRLPLQTVLSALSTLEMTAEWIAVAEVT